MSQTLQELLRKAIMVRDHYNELQAKDGKEIWNAQDRMAGFVGDVGALSKLVMVKQGLRRGPANIDEELAHELSDCLWSIMVLADELNIDLEAAFSENMNQLHTRIEREKANLNVYAREHAS